MWGTPGIQPVTTRLVSVYNLLHIHLLRQLSRVGNWYTLFTMRERYYLIHNSSYRYNVLPYTCQIDLVHGGFEGSSNGHHVH